MRDLRATERFRRDVATLPSHIRSETNDLIQQLRHDPLDPTIDTKKLSGVRGNTYRARVGEYRLVYSFTPKTLLL